MSYVIVLIEYIDDFARMVSYFIFLKNVIKIHCYQENNFGLYFCESNTHMIDLKNDIDLNMFDRYNLLSISG